MLTHTIRRLAYMVIILALISVVAFTVIQLPKFSGPGLRGTALQHNR